MPYEEHDNETPEWEIEDEKIPPSLEKKWRDEEKQGLRAGVCRSCGFPFTKQDLSCSHCGEPTNLSDGFIVSIKKFFLATPLGILSFIIILAAVVLFLVR